MRKTDTTRSQTQKKKESSLMTARQIRAEINRTLMERSRWELAGARNGKRGQADRKG